MPRWASLLLAASEACTWGCGASPLTPADTAILGAYADEQTNCVIDNRGDGGAIDACRAGVKRFYDRIQAAKFGDAAVTP